MKRIKKGLALSRETVRTLASDQLHGVHGAMINPTYNCYTTRCPPTALCASAANPHSGCTSCPSCGDCTLTPR